MAVRAKRLPAWHETAEAPAPGLPRGATLSVSIFHIGLSLDHPLIPVEERPKIEKRLRELQERMTRAGYKYQIIQVSPETGLDGFKHQLEMQPCDGVLIGGGVVGNEAMSYFMEQIINSTHELAPKAKIMFYNHSVRMCSKLLSAGSELHLAKTLLFRKGRFSAASMQCVIVFESPD